MRILFLNRSFYPDITATGQLLTELCESLVNDYKCEVTIVAGRPLSLPGDFKLRAFRWGIFRRESFRGIEIIRINNTGLSTKSFFGRVSNYLTYFFWSFFSVLKIRKPDLVVALTDPPVIGLAGMWVSLFYRIPFVISVRDIFPEASRGLKDEHKIINLFLEGINRFLFRKAGHLAALGNLMKKRIEEKGGRSSGISIIPDWADCDKIFPVSKNNQFSSKNRIEGKFVVMYAGNIGASSGLEFVISGAEILKEHKDIVFVFVGEGIMKEKLAGLVAAAKLDNILFFPYQPKDSLSEVFSSADIFLLPLKKGLSGFSLPSKIYSYLAAGRPYIACVDQESEVTQITTRYNCGLISKPEDPRELSANIIWLYKNSQSRLLMGKNARDAAFFFDRKKGVEKYYALFKAEIGCKKAV